MMGASGKSLVAMFITMQFSNQLDDTDHDTILFARTFFVAYVGIAFVLYALMSNRIMQKNDPRMLLVSPPPNPFAAAAAAAAAAPEARDGSGAPSSTSADPDLPAGVKRQTVMEYDKEMVDTAQRGLLMNAVMVGGLHYKMGTLSPIIMTSVLGMVRLLEDPQVKLHLFGMEDVGGLERPFKSHNPLMEMLGMGGPTEETSGPEQSGGTAAAAGSRTTGANAASAVADTDTAEEEVEVLEEVEYIDENDLDDETRKKLDEQDTAESKKDK